MDARVSKSLICTKEKKKARGDPHSRVTIKGRDKGTWTETTHGKKGKEYRMERDE